MTNCVNKHITYDFNCFLFNGVNAIAKLCFFNMYIDSFVNIGNGNAARDSSYFIIPFISIK